MARKKKKESWWDNASNGGVLALAVVIAVMRYLNLPIPVLDNVVAQVKQSLFGASSPDGGTKTDDFEASMKEVEAGRPIVLDDVLTQLKHFCAQDGRGKCEDWLDSLPSVAKSVKSGPGTWDRKKLKKAKTLELDRLLGVAAAHPDIGGRTSDLAIIGKELLDMSPKSVKEDLSIRNLVETTIAADKAKKKAEKEKAKAK